MKTLHNIQADMSDLYDSFKLGAIQREDAAELANIAGKFLMAEKLILANKQFEESLKDKLALPHSPPRQVIAEDIFDVN